MPPRLWIPQQLPRPTATPAEARSLYRDILRTARHFHWTNEKKEPWNRVLKETARREFEEARQETDPLIIARLLVTGRQCLEDVQRKFRDANHAAWKRIQDERS